MKSLAKSDINLVADMHRDSVEELLFLFIKKLYIRNPRELKKGQELDLNSKLKYLFDRSNALEEINPKNNGKNINHLPSSDGIKLLNQAFDLEFKGDRVESLAIGLIRMIDHSYNQRREFYLFHELDHQKLYLSARNLEVLSWRLRTAKDSTNNLLIYSNDYELSPPDVSYERIISQLIVHQDVMANIIANKTQRRINFVAQNIARASFLPL